MITSSGVGLLKNAPLPLMTKPLAFTRSLRSFFVFQQAQRRSPKNTCIVSHSTSRPGLAVYAAAGGKVTTKRPSVTDLKAKIEQLEAENMALRAALAANQGVSSENIQSISSEDDTSYLSELTQTDAGAGPYCTEELESDGEAGNSAAFHSATSPVEVQVPDQVLADIESGIQWPQPGESPPFFDRAARAVPLPVPGDGSAHSNAPLPTEHPLHVMHVTAEMAPCAKVGGLGDVVTGLSKACLAQGHNPEVILPFYECLPEDAVEDLAFDRAFDCPKGNFFDGNMSLSTLRTVAWTGKIEGVPVILLRPDWEATGSPLFRGSRIYGGSYNETEAYLYFCRAALEYIVQSGRRPQVIHAHEWQAGAVPMLFWELFASALPNSRPVLTIHNMDNSGEVRQDEFAATGVNGELFADVDKALDERTIGHNPERLCLLKGGIVYSSVVTTVSPTYAMETLTGGAAGWLRSTLARPEIADKYWGVLNGIDTDMWDPASDTLLPACYSSSMPQGKALCKRYLQQGLGMDVDPNKPLVAVISRLVPQKGIHLIEHSVGRTVSQGGQFVLLGTGHADGGLRRLAGDTYGTDHPDVRMIFGYSERLAHLIYAAADIFLVPSMFEPCGLTQMIALRYGAVPVVRSTGGLADTVRDVDAEWDDGNLPGAPSPNGFVFEGIDAGSIDSALDRALDKYLRQREDWENLKVRNLKEGERWSWTAPARSYIQLYSGVAG